MNQERCTKHESTETPTRNMSKKTKQNRTVPPKLLLRDRGMQIFAPINTHTK